MKKKVLVLQPDYVEKFVCIGDKCEYDCCSGWDIGIDKKTFKKYRKINSNKPIKTLINKNVIKEKECVDNSIYAKIKLSEKSKTCPFLNKNKLCEIYIQCGEECLSNTCNQYPRILNTVDGVIERSCYTSCPEIANFFFNKDSMTFDQLYDEIDMKKSTLSMDLNTDSEVITHKNFWILREISIDIIQNRNFTLEERMFILGLVINKVEKDIKSGETDIKKVVNDALSTYYNRNINKYFKELEFKDILKKDFINLLFNTNFKNENTINNYRNLFLEFFEGIDYYNDDLNSSFSTYEKGYASLYFNFFNDKEYILENYFVNDMFHNLFPVKRGLDLFEEYSTLVIKFAILKILLVGVGNYHSKLDESIVKRTLYLYSRNLEHASRYVESILERIKLNNDLNMAYMSLLIRR
ncbi:flagellin lysine-N-methylase [Clostridium botulinum]|uniref:flagellin lysine-N-methylase n=1 Tax=Clostridium botulinum TaxID=1491 RepID=UPI000A174B62|nr:flagellin lysine-N-methylase [Clostridium botulinum]MBN1041177.1 hypothetical protein [Clostridium botulinum]MBN1047815.1 hypothetical protein [Clostridium botulinum]NFO29856.1 hypothetical protein [Clostridium botulinum]NFO52626.1 hypothetical protein [Clostridium botulinum]